MSNRTALHWACKRGHASIAQVLLQNGADLSIKNFKGELASELTTSTEVLAALKLEPDDDFAKRCSEGMSTLPFVPNYLRSPVFPYASADDDIDVTSSSSSMSAVHKDCHTHSTVNGPDCINGENPVRKAGSNDSGKILASGAQTLAATSPVILRVRVSGSEADSDFVEVEVPSLSYSSLLECCCEELEVVPGDVAKIRKLPNVWVRKDKDVQRLKEGQELELILSKE